MISLKVLNEWIVLDTLNGFYRLDDLFSEVGSPEGFNPEDFVKHIRPTRVNGMDGLSIEGKYTWANQAYVYLYAGFLDKEFQRIMDEVKSIPDVFAATALARTIATGVIHK